MFRADNRKKIHKISITLTSSGADTGRLPCWFIRYEKKNIKKIKTIK